MVKFISVAVAVAPEAAGLAGKDLLLLVEVGEEKRSLLTFLLAEVLEIIAEAD